MRLLDSSLQEVGRLEEERAEDTRTEAGGEVKDWAGSTA